MSLIEYSRLKLTNRIHIIGKLVFNTAFHLGGGHLEFGSTDSPVVRDSDGRPLIPGSSIKGAVRAAVERIVPDLGLTACGIFNRDVNCLTPQDEKQVQRESFRQVLEALNKPLKNVRKQINNVLAWKDQTFDNMLTALNIPFESGSMEKVTEKILLFLLDHSLCDVCQAFGSPFLASAIFFHDAPVAVDQWLGVTQVRDGVGIDRDSGRTVPEALYDYEVVPPQTAFNFSMTIESNHPKVLGLAALGLYELIQGNIPLGGIKSRGLGRCQLARDTKVEKLVFSDRAALVQYLQKGTIQSQQLEEFVSENLTHILPEEVAHV